MTSLASFMKLSHRKFIAVAMAAGIAASGTLVWSASNAAFTNYTTNPSNTWTTGVVGLTDDDGGTLGTNGTAMFTATNVLPGDTHYRCIKVTSPVNSTAATAVKLFRSASTDADGVGAKLDLVIQIDDSARGVFGTQDTDCGTFTATGAPIYSGTLANFIANNASYADDDAGGAHAGGVQGGTPWVIDGTATSRTYKFTWTLNASADDTLQGKTASVAFRWSTS